MTLEEALKKAQEAIDEGYINSFPRACIILAKEVKRLNRKLKKEDNAIKDE